MNAGQMEAPDFTENEKHSWSVLADSGEVKALEFVRGDLCELQKELPV